jgi:succinylglutamate desuccinylase
MKIITIGNGSPCVGIVACLHGNETVGLDIIEHIKTLKIIKGTLKLIIANTAAIKLGKRFVDMDLNRAFPGDPKGNYEQKEAHKLIKELEDCNYVLDIHSCGIKSPAFAILTKINSETINLIKMIGLDKVVIMPNSLANKKALIDYCNGISLELGLHNNTETLKQGIKSTLNFLGNLGIINYDVKNIEYNTFNVIKKIPKVGKVIKSDIYSFQKVKEGDLLYNSDNKNIYSEEEFYAILPNEPSYGFFCLAATMEYKNER